jgi:peptide/nickel transport system permease protein
MTGPLSRLYRTIRAHPSVAWPGSILTIVAIAALAAPIIEPYDPTTIYGADLAGPTSTHWLGLDYSGHDLMTILIWGARGSLKIGFLASLIALVVGGTVGLAGGYFGGWIDVVAAFVTDFFLVIPILPLMITIAALYGTSQSELIAIIGLLSWMGTARVVRAQVRSLRERTYVRRARSLGAGHVRTILVHILPHIIPMLAASTTLAVASAIFFEAALSFLGLGDTGQPSWGTTIELNFQGGAATSGAWGAIFWPGAAIGLVVLCSNLVGRGFERSLNPRLHAYGLTRTFRILIPPVLASARSRVQAGGSQP